MAHGKSASMRLVTTEPRRRTSRLSSFVRITSVPMLFRSCADGAMAPGESLDTDKCIEAKVVGWSYTRALRVTG
jgi:hypothetical protein